MKTQEQLRAILVEIYNCASAWDNDDGKMAEANEKTPEDILAGYLEEEKKVEREKIRIKLDSIVNAHLWGDYGLSTREVYDGCKELLQSFLENK